MQNPLLHSPSCQRNRFSFCPGLTIVLFVCMAALLEVEENLFSPGDASGTLKIIVDTMVECSLVHEVYIAGLNPT